MNTFPTIDPQMVAIATQAQTNSFILDILIPASIPIFGISLLLVTFSFFWREILDSIKGVFHG